MQPLYEDNHIIIVNKAAGEIVQGDKTGDIPLSDKVKAYIKEKYHKPGNVFLGVVHRIDRPVAGIVVFARTGKALSRLDKMFQNGDVEKTYLAFVRHLPEPPNGILVNWLKRNEKLNKCFAYDHQIQNSKRAELKYRVVGHSKTFHLVEIKLLTGRHHQIRCQLANIGCPIIGDLKYGDKRSNGKEGISLLAWKVQFSHPISHKEICITAPIPNNSAWQMATSAFV